MGEEEKMVKSETFSYLEKTLKQAQQLMKAVIEQNEKWPGGGALEEDIAVTGSLLKEAELSLAEIRERILQQTEQAADIDLKPANEMFDKAHQILNVMYHDMKVIRISLEKNVSQTRGIRDLDIQLHKFISHCEETRHYLEEVTKTERG
jgi:exonuclease VII small subunit